MSPGSGAPENNIYPEENNRSAVEKPPPGRGAGAALPWELSREAEAAGKRVPEGNHRGHPGHWVAARYREAPGNSPRVTGTAPAPCPAAPVSAKLIFLRPPAAPPLAEAPAASSSAVRTSGRTC